MIILITKKKKKGSLERKKCNYLNNSMKIGQKCVKAEAEKSLIVFQTVCYKV